MDLAFYVDPMFPQYGDVAVAFARGCKVNGDRCRIEPADEQKLDADVAVIGGLFDDTRAAARAYRAAGRPIVFLDKGYGRIKSSDGGSVFWRASVNDTQPLAYFHKRPRPADRLSSSGLSAASKRRRGETVLFAGCSDRLHAWYDLPSPFDYASAVIKDIARYTDRPVVYRPKPTCLGPGPVPGAKFSDTVKFRDDLDAADLVVTYGAGVCLEAVAAGVPVLVLGNAVTRPVSETDIAKVAVPKFPSQDEVRLFLRNLSYCQWTLAEMRSGEAWADLRPIVEANP